MPEDKVVLFDVNALVALCLSTHQHHRAAHRFLGAVSAWSTAPMTEAALMRLLLNPSISGRQLAADDVGSVLAGFRTDPRWRFLTDASSLADPQVDLSVLMGHQQVTDLHLVNLAARTGVRLATFDVALATWLAPQDHRHLVVIPT